MSIQHSTIADPDIHEPKDVATATAGHVYTADGGGSGNWSYPELEGTDSATEGQVAVSDGAGGTSWKDVAPEVTVNSIADLPTPVLVGGVSTIVPEEKEYLINGDLTITTPIGHPGAGKTATFRAVNRSTVTYTGTDALFRDTDAQGNIEIQGLTQWEAPNGDMWDITASTGSWSFQAVGAKFTNCNSLGQVDGGSSAAGVFNTFFGTMSNFDQGLVATNLSFFEPNTTFVFGNNALGCVYFTVDGTATTGNVNFFLNTFKSGTNETMFYINPEISGTVSNVNFNGNHLEGDLNGAVFASGSADIDSTYVSSAGNDGIMPNTKPDGLLSLNGNTTQTVITAPSTPTVIAGTWSNEGVSQFTATAGGRLTYTGKTDVKVPMSAVVTMTTALGTDVGAVMFAKNGTAIQNSSVEVELDSAVSSPTSITTFWQLTLSTGDYLELMVSNRNDDSNLTVADAIFRVN